MLGVVGGSGLYEIDGLSAVKGADHLIALIGPFELALEAFVILHDQQHGQRDIVGHAEIFSCNGVKSAQASGRVSVKRVPSPGRLSTAIRPPMARTRLRASKAPMPKPPCLVEAKGAKPKSFQRAPG